MPHFRAGKRFLWAWRHCRVAVVILVILASVNADPRRLVAFKLDMDGNEAPPGPIIANALFCNTSYRSGSRLTGAGAASRAVSPPTGVRRLGCLVSRGVCGEPGPGVGASSEVFTSGTSGLSTTHLAAEPSLATVSTASLLFGRLSFPVSIRANMRIGRLVGAGPLETVRRQAAKRHGPRRLCSGPAKSDHRGLLGRPTGPRNLYYDTKSMLEVGSFRMVDSTTTRSWKCVCSGASRGLGWAAGPPRRGLSAASTTAERCHATSGFPCKLGPPHLGLDTRCMALMAHCEYGHHHHHRTTVILVRA